MTPTRLVAIRLMTLEPGGSRPAPLSQVQAVGCSLDSLHDLIFPFQHTGRTGALPQLATKSGAALIRVVSCETKGGMKYQHEQCQDNQGRDVDGEDCPVTFEPPALKELHCWVQGEGEEQRDGDHGQPVGCQEEEADNPSNRHQDEQDDQHRARANHHDPLGNRFAGRGRILRDSVFRYGWVGLFSPSA